MSRRKQDDHVDERLGPGGGNGHGEPEPPAATEPTGLAGVDAEPLQPLSREQVEALRKENEELRDQLLRRRADFENYRKRVERDRQQAGVDASAAILKELIPSLDNLERALKSEGADQTLRAGVELIQRELGALLQSHGVVVHDPLGQSFDPQIHQALSHEAGAGVADGIVVEVFRKGYFFKDRLLRPALVKVAKGADESVQQDPEAVH